MLWCTAVICWTNSTLMKMNEAKYPVEKAKGSNKKYTEL